MLEARLGAGIGHAVFLPALGLVGLFVGFIAGMFGVGGGFLLTPVLMYGFGVPVPIAVGSALCQKCGTFEQALHGYVSLKLAMVILAGSSIGSQLGALTTHYLPNRVLRLIFMLLIVAVVAMICWDLTRLLR